MPSSPQHPSVSWTELLKTTRDFFNAQPWKKIRHEALFAIDNPRSGEVLYCTALGGSGDVYGMSIYPGAKGLYTYLLTQQRRLQESVPFYYMDCFLVSLENQQNLSPEDKHILKQSKLSFPKGAAKPQFRSFSSGYMQTLPDPSERYAINLAMQGTLAVLRNWSKFQKEFDLFSAIIPIIVFDESTGMMDMRYEEPKMPSLPMLLPPPLNEIRMRSLVKQCKKQGTWEGSLYYIPSPVQEKGKRGFFPSLAIWADHQSGMILGTDMAERKNCSESLVRSLCATIEQTQVIPEIVLIDDQRIASALKPAAEALGITLREAGVLSCLEGLTAVLSRDQFKGDPISPVLGPDIISEEEYERLDDDEVLDDAQALDAYETLDAKQKVIVDLLIEFSNGLMVNGLARATVQKHLNNVSTFIFQFLQDVQVPPLSIEEGINHVSDFFEQTIAMRSNKPSKSLRKSMLTSIRKFYKFLADNNSISGGAMKQLDQEIKANRGRWTS